MNENLKIIKEKCDSRNYKKIVKLENNYIFKFAARFIRLLNRRSIFVCHDSESDFDYIRNKTIRDGEEKKLSTEGHTVHFDSYYDQGRDKEHTRLLIPKGFYAVFSTYLQRYTWLLCPVEARMITKHCFTKGAIRCILGTPIQNYQVYL